MSTQASKQALPLPARLPKIRPLACLSVSLSIEPPDWLIGRAFTKSPRKLARRMDLLANQIETHKSWGQAKLPLERRPAIQLEMKRQLKFIDNYTTSAHLVVRACRSCRSNCADLCPFCIELCLK